jgi:hypothetical protein
MTIEMIYGIKSITPDIPVFTIGTEPPTLLEKIIDACFRFAMFAALMAVFLGGAWAFEKNPKGASLAFTTGFMATTMMMNR